ncbi:MAG: HMA2 domain-containing protein [Gammaproteobacteria bacterium]
MSRIVSSVAGRIRVRDKSLRNLEKLNELKNELSKITPLTELKGDVRTGSLLIRYNRRAAQPSVVEENLETALDQVIGKPARPQALLSKKNINRYNKIIMLGSLAASLVALKIAHRKPRIRWHKLTGYLFVANLGVHLYIYRKGLLRMFR